MPGLYCNSRLDDDKVAIFTPLTPKRGIIGFELYDVYKIEELESIDVRLK